MGLLFQTSFDHYTTVLNRFTSTVGDVPPSNHISITSGGRNATSRLKIERFSGGASTSRVSRTLPSSIAEIFFAFAVKVPSVANSGTTVTIAEVTDTSTVQLALRLTAIGTLAIYRGTTFLADVPDFIISANVWYHIEMRALIDPSVGEVEIRINEVDHAISGSGSLNTRSSANSSVNVITLALIENGGAAIADVSFDDVIVRDDDWSGDAEVLALLPTGTGTTDQWTASGAATTREAVDEAAPNGDTDYATTSNVGDLSLHTYPDVPTTSTVQAVVALPYVEKTDAGTAKIKSTARSGGTNYDGDEKAPSDSSYDYLPHIWETDPDTAAAWTPTGVNAAEFGFKRTA